MAERQFDGVHVFAFHKKESARPQLRRVFGDFQRIIWLGTSQLQIYGEKPFDDEIQKLLEFEERWRSRLRPNSHRDVLILPETSFSPKKPFDALWRRNRDICLTVDEINRLETYGAEFAIAHSPPPNLNGYMDANGRVFKYDGARHGKIGASSLYGWKFTYHVGTDFHYDVQHRLGTESVSVIDAKGKRHIFTTHANMDMHGYLLGDGPS